ncbi:hypothetical protein FE392_02230 [Xenorhabdus sp. 12]|uniref:Inverse autotransporter beta-domain domain-containing protein n=1 Tax=Xenorhabdus santafensis TaxID=2582833 RepID=A0ABU4S4K8_9GAMM|nr:inverse autotransporter beta domain-containing protein [Xenorhabdus sp. 12]MDX7986156.1 hypothetical protein [Xenorhabdus sp. 12]
MSSYISKFIVFFVFLYTLLIPSTMINAFAEEHLSTAKTLSQEIDAKDNMAIQVNALNQKNLNSITHKENHIKKNNETLHAESTDYIVKNLHTASHILSSSPSELAEQARSYALGKFNNTVSSETQKWLSQFGMARINFGLDKKGTLENNSFDLLLPFYDNKTDWLFFSQVGYRHKDNRNTVNIGLGGRYFYQNWMYGLNTFYDHDLTGQNQRMGLGGEIWGDYIKLSANTYWRLSHWQNSRNFQNYHERPANGYDIQGEFFLPAYPNLGAKLAYEQYFGDNITLFNRDTKQKNPSLAKLSLTYTPIPLFTLGVDYKQGESNHTETQFLASLNYKLGTPLRAQLSPENVTSMRTLASSRYDLVERNNNIVLEHQKKPIAKLSLPATLVGFSHEQQDIKATLSSNESVKQIHWTTNKDFIEHGGKLSSNTGNTIKVTLPTYLPGNNQNNNYPIYALAEMADNQKSVPVEIMVIVRPFMVKKQSEANFIPSGPLSATGNKEDGYTFNPIVTFDTVNNSPIKNITLDNVQWATEPKTGPESGLQFINWQQPTSVALDGNGQFNLKPILTSTQPHENVKVYLQFNGQPPQLVGEVSFNETAANFYVDRINVSPQETQVANGKQAYKFTAVILDHQKNPARTQKIPHVTWSKDKNVDGLIWEPQEGDLTTDEHGKLTTTLASNDAIENVMVSLSIDNQKPVNAERAVSFIADTASYHIQDNRLDVDLPGPLSANGQHSYTFTGIVVDGRGQPVRTQKIESLQWSVTKEGQDESHNPNLKLRPNSDTTAPDGKLTATLTSTEAIDKLLVSLVIGKQQPANAQKLVAFVADTKSYHIQKGIIKVKPEDKPFLTANGIHHYTYSAVVADINGNPVPNQEIANVRWDSDKKVKGLNLEYPSTKTDDGGYLYAKLSSTTAVNNIAVSLAIEEQAPVKAQQVVSFKPEHITIQADKPTPQAIYETYIYTATITDADGKPEAIENVHWDWEPKIKGVTLTSLSQEGDDSKNGQFKAELTSTVEASNVVVTVSTNDKNAKSAPPVEFQWPTIEKITLTPKNGTVPPDGQKAYQIDTNVVLKSGNKTTPYAEQKIKFKWELNLPAGSKPNETWLSDTKDVTAQTGGKLAVFLYSTQKDPDPVIREATVCLNIVNAPKPSKQNCSEPINFQEPPIDFDIKKIEVYGVEQGGSNGPFDSKKPLIGNGKDKYLYRALITKKGTNDAIKRHTFSNVNWAHDQTQIDTNELPKTQPDNPKNEATPFTTDDEGYLYATLNSHVGVGKDIKVTLKMHNQKTGEEETSNTGASNSVRFDPEVNTAVMYAYNINNESIANQIFKEPQPYNYFLSLAARLRSSKKPNEDFDTSDLTYKFIPINTNLDQNMVSLGEYNKGPITVNGNGTGKIQAMINRKNGVIELHEYILTTGRYLMFNPGNNQDIYFSANDGIDCSSNGAHFVNYTIEDFKSNSNGRSVHDEFKNLYNWGVFYYHSTNVKKGDLRLKLQSGDGYKIYNSITDEIDNSYDAKGLLICSTISSSVN